MDDYDACYEEYKNRLLRSSSFSQKLREKHKNTIYNEAAFIDTNGVLTKIGLLSFVCGAILVFTWVININIVIRLVLTALAVGCCFLVLHIGSEFKAISGRSNFRRFVYDQHIADRVKEDKDIEARNIVRSFLSGEISKEEFKNRYDELSKYDRFAKDLINDYEFNTLIQKRI